MPTDDHCVTIVPYFEITEGATDEVKAELAKFVEKTSAEPKCLFYGYSFHGNRAHCREGYADAEGALAHLANIGEMLEALLASGTRSIARFYLAAVRGWKCICPHDAAKPLSWCSWLT